MRAKPRRLLRVPGKKECLEQGLINEAMIREEMGRNHVRHDALEVLERIPPLAPAA